MNRIPMRSALIPVVLATFACGGDSARTVEEAGSASSKTASASGALVERAVEPAALAPFLPETFAGLDRDMIRENTEEFQGAVSSGVDADYGAGTPGRLPPLTIAIWDHGPSAYYLRTYGILEVEMEEEGGGELNRHLKFRGHPTGEREYRSGETLEASMQIFVAGRYLVDIEARGLTLEQLRAGAATLALERLAEMDQN